MAKVVDIGAIGTSENARRGPGGSFAFDAGRRSVPAMRVLLWARSLVWLGFVAGCAAPPLREEVPLTATELAAPVAWVEFDRDRLERAIFTESNRARQRHGREPFRAYPRLERAADLQAYTTALVGFPSHFNPMSGQANVYDRVQAAGIDPGMVGENVAVTPLRQTPAPGEGSLERSEWPTQSYAELARRIVQQWLDSPPHRASLLNPHFTHQACGVALARSPLGDELVFSVQVLLRPGRVRR